MKTLKKICSVVPFLAKTFWNIIKFFWGIIRTKIFWIIFMALLWSCGVYLFAQRYHFENPLQIKLKCLVCHNEAGKTEKPREMPEKAIILSPTSIPKKQTKSEYEIVMDLKHGEILWKIYQLESQKGKTDYCRLNGLGYGGFGVLDDNNKIVCYQSFEKTAQRADFWLTKIGVDKDIATALCTYNTGIRQPNCLYYQSYLTL